MAEAVFSKQLQALRKQKGFTQEQLAKELGVSPQAVSKWENGSYPEGDLLPKLADFFEVSIDYLYGRAKKASTFEQEMLDRFNEEYCKKGEEGFWKNYFELLTKALWAGNLSSRKTEWYYEMEGNGGNENVVAITNTDCGFEYWKTNSEKRFYFMMPEPAQGFARRFQPTKELTELFSFLSDMDHLKILQFAMTTTRKEAFTAELVAKKVGISVEKAREALSFMCRGGKYYNSFMNSGRILTEKDVRETYTVNQSNAQSYLMVLAAAEEMQNPPNSLISVERREKPWFEKIVSNEVGKS